MTLAIATVAAIMDSALKQTDRLDFIGPFFATAASAQGARNAIASFPAPGFTERQAAGIVRCVSASSKWRKDTASGADASNLSLLQSVLGALAGATLGDPTPITGGGNFVPHLPIAIPP